MADKDTRLNKSERHGDDGQVRLVRKRPQNAPPRRRQTPNGTRSPEPSKKKQAEQNDDSSEGTVFSSLIKAMVYIILVIIAAVFLAYFIIVSANDIFAFVKSDELVEITLQQDENLEGITDILHDNGIIEYPTLFKLYSKVKKDDGVFLAGTYTISPSMNYDYLLSAFKPSFSRKTVWITIPEGYCVEDIITLFTSNGVSSREEFITAINDIEYDFAFLKPLYENPPTDRTYMLEGYLYPDKYEFYVDSSAETVIYKLLDNFDKKFDELYYERAAELGMTVDEVLTIASLIQSEAYYLDEYEYISSVFHNRLASPNFPKLESDATFVYAYYCATLERPDPIASAKFFESKYNTYLYDGLPPGPICSPSYNAITCALYPADSDYYYFVSDSSGRMIFSRTYTEHLNAISKLN
jgi:UPF0755 protein